MLTEQEKQQYLEEVIIPQFATLIEQQVYSVIFDFNFKIQVCTNASARSVGMPTWHEMVGLSFSNHQDVDLGLKIFSAQYNENFIEYIHQYTQKIYEVQKQVFIDKTVISFIDLLPYKGHFQSYLVTYVPIFHPTGEVIAIQSYATRSRFFSHHEYLNLLVDDKLEQSYPNLEKLTPRENEIMFLLASGLSQDLIAQTLKVSRSTIANIIANQLCAKFGILGSNTKLLTQKALKYEFHQTVPASLYRPYIILLDDNSLKNN